MNQVIEAVRDNPQILQQIVNDPDYMLNTHQSHAIERKAFKQINMQAFGKRRFASAKLSTLKNYYRFLSPIEHTALRLERKYMQSSVLKGYQLYEEIARVMSIKLHAYFTWREVKGILEFASEIIADIELSRKG